MTANHPAHPVIWDKTVECIGLTKREWLMANAPVPSFISTRGEMEDIARRKGDTVPYIPDAKVIAEQARLARLWADAIIKEAARDG